MVRCMGRGERYSGHRGGEGFKGHGVRGSNDDRRNPVEPENDPYRDLRDNDEDQPDLTNNEYIWPIIEEEEDI